MTSENKPRKVFGIAIFVLVTLFVICITIAAIGLVKQLKQSDDETLNIKTNEIYAVPSNMSDYQKELFEELSDICNSINDIENEDLSELASSVAKNFIADYLSWGNKRGSYDVGGIGFVYGPYHMNFSFNARDGYYSDLDLLIKEYGSTNLPMVKNIAIDSVIHQDDKYKVTIQKYDYSNNSSYSEDEYYDAYLVKAHWEYEMPEESKYDASNLPVHGYFMLIKLDGRLEIGYFHEDYVRELGNE